jgi:hypothetical protein
MEISSCRMSVSEIRKGVLAISLATRSLWWNKPWATFLDGQKI